MDEASTALAAALAKAARVLACSSADNAAEHDRAALYGLLVGWDCERAHQHSGEDPDCDSAMDSVAARFAWDARQVAELRQMRTAIRVAADYGDPGYRRSCDWPGCLASYNAAAVAQGLTGAPGWVRVSGFWAGLLLCCEHAATVHVPSARQVGAGAQVTCGCGIVSQLLERSNGFFAKGWWQGHVAD